MQTFGIGIQARHSTLKLQLVYWASHRSFQTYHDCNIEISIIHFDVHDPRRQISMHVAA